MMARIEQKHVAGSNNVKYTINPGTWGSVVVKALRY
jgi:hypothetical protein